MRRAVETEISVLTALMPSTIHAVTFQGFQIKLLAFILAFSINKAFDSNIWQLRLINIFSYQAVINVQFQYLPQNQFQNLLEFHHLLDSLCKCLNHFRFLVPHLHHLYH